MNKRFLNKVVIVTGSGRGIGKAIAIAFAKEGANVILTSRSEKELNQVSEQIRNLAGECFSIRTDVSKEMEVVNLFETVLNKFGTVDILVNNAAIQIRKKVTEMTIDDWNMQIDINLTGTFLCSKEALKIMTGNNYGKIITISSESGRKGWGTGSAYCASKAGQISLTEAMASEVKNYNININTILPAAVDTPLLKKSYPNIDYLKIDLLTPEEVSSIVLFLASEDAKGIKGSCIEVYGGQNLIEE